MKKFKKGLIKFLKKPKVERAIKTFIEAFSSYVAVKIVTVDVTDKTALYGLIAGAIGSAISVILNVRTVE
jgi:hypothetical protein